MGCKDAIKISKNKILINLHVTPSSDYSVFPAGYNKWRKCIEIKVNSKAKENKANIEVIQKIAKYFNISTKDIFIVDGQKSREKTVSINNLQINEVYNKLEESLNGL